MLTPGTKEGIDERLYPTVRIGKNLLIVFFLIQSGKVQKRGLEWEFEIGVLKYGSRHICFSVRTAAWSCATRWKEASSERDGALVKWPTLDF